MITMVDNNGVVPPWLDPDGWHIWDDATLPVMPLPPLPPDWDVPSHVGLLGTRWTYDFGYPKGLPDSKM